MKLNKTMGRVATTLVATAMLASVAVVPAFATEPTQSNMTGGAVDNADNSALTEIVFQKDLVIPAGVATPNVTFTFDLAGAEAGEDEVATDNTTTVKVLDGTGHGSLLNVPVTFDSNSTVTDVAEGDDKTQTVTEYVKLDLTTPGSGFTFNAPGIYKYTLTEDDLNDSNYTESAPYTVYLYVERLESEGEDSYVITGATLFSGDSEDDPDSKTNVMTNYYLTNPEGDVTPNSLTVDKTVSGNMGDKSKEFDFEITITAKNNASNRNYTATNATVTNNQDGTYTVTGNLHHEESLVINGLVAGDKYKINEKAYDQDGYTSSVSTQGVESLASSSFVNNETEITFDATSADSASYTNHRDAVSPTGIVMNVAPYALLVVVAAAGCFVFMRKRRED